MSEAQRGERLQKVLARAGVASRRAAEGLIALGRVRVNGLVVSEMGQRVQTTDRVEVEDRPITGPASPIYLVLNKPSGYVSTARDPEGRPTVFALVRSNHRVYSVGRLDWDSEGLLLLTNDGDLTHRLTHPRYGVEKEYHALVEGYPNQVVVDRLAAGVALSDGPTAPAAARRLRAAPEGCWMALTIHEGRYRQVRRMLEAVGHPVRRLIRVRVGPIDLGELRTGEWRVLGHDEVARLRRSVGLEASADRHPAGKIMPRSASASGSRPRAAPAERKTSPASSRRPPGTRP